MANSSLGQSVADEQTLKKQASMLGLKFVKLTDKQIADDILSIIPFEIAKENDIISYEKTGNKIKLAVGNADRLRNKAPQFLAELKTKHGYELEIALTTPGDISYALNLYNPKGNVSLSSDKINSSSIVEKTVVDVASKIAPVLAEINLKEVLIRPEVINKFPKEVAEKYKIICFELAGDNKIKVGIVDNSNPQVNDILDFVKKRNNVEIEKFKISEDDLQYALHLYDKFQPKDNSKKITKNDNAESKNILKDDVVNTLAPNNDIDNQTPIFNSQPTATTVAVPLDQKPNEKKDEAELDQKAIFLTDKEFELEQKEKEILSRIKELDDFKAQLVSREKNTKLLEEGVENKKKELLAEQANRSKELEAKKLELDKLNSELASQANSLNEKENALVGKEKELSIKNEEIVKSKSDLELINEEILKEKQKIKQTQSNLIARTNELIQKTQILEEKSNSLYSKEGNLTKKQEEIDVERQNLDNLKHQIESLKIELQNKETILGKNSELLEQKQKELANSWQVVEYLKAEKNEIIKQKEALNNLKNSEKIKDLESFAVQSKAIKDQKESLGNEIIELEKGKKLADTQLEDLKKQISDAKLEFNKLQEDKNTIKGEISSIQNHSEKPERNKHQFENDSPVNIAKPDSKNNPTESNIDSKLDFYNNANVTPAVNQEVKTNLEVLSGASESKKSENKLAKDQQKSTNKAWWQLDVKDIGKIFSGERELVDEDKNESIEKKLFVENDERKIVEPPFWQEGSNQDASQEVNQEDKKEDIVKPEPIPVPVTKNEAAPVIESSKTINPFESSKPTVSAHSSADREGDLEEENILDNYFQAPIKSTEELQAIVKTGFVPKIVAAVLYLASSMKASDIHLEPLESKFRLRYRIDGVLKDIVEMPNLLHPPVLSRLKILSHLKIDENRIPQDGRFSIRIGEKDIDLRISTFPTAHGEKAEMRILDKSMGLLELDKIGFNGSNMVKVKSAIAKPYGVVLVTGPTGSGKTTTLYAMLNTLSKPSVNIVTLEDPVEYDLAGINQCQINPKIGFTFAEGLRSILRQDPNIIMVGEIRDKETAELTTHAALTGHLVLSTLHTNDAAGALPRLINMGIEPFLITSSINAVIAQRLVRKLCPNCKESFTPSPAILDHLKSEINGITSKDAAQWKGKELKFYKQKGCSECDAGYRGRIGIFEVLEMSPEIESLAIANKPSSEIFTSAHNAGMLTFREDGLLKALAGETTLDEIFQATGEISKEKEEKKE